MSTPSNEDAESSAPEIPTKAERIQQLNDIEKSISTLLQSAAAALQTLSASQSSSGPPPSQRQVAFQHASNSYFTMLQILDVNLKRQIWGLEEAGIIPTRAKAKVPTKSAHDLKLPQPVSDLGDGVVGKLDVGWLNTRSGRVGRDTEAELWEKAKAFLEEQERGEGNGGRNGDIDMED